MEETLTEKPLTEQPQSRPLFSRRDLTRLIWPLVVEQGLAIAVGLADSIMVASVGEAAVSGVSLVDMISILLINIFAALATGGVVVVSQFVGARDLRTARRATDQLVISTVALSLLITVLVLAFRQGLLELFFGRVEPDVMENCLIYIAITSLAYPFIALYNSCAAVFRAQGNSKISMKVSLLMNAVNLGGNAILIYGLKMGVAGVAIPTLVSRMAAAAVILYLLCHRDSPLRLSPLRQIRPDLRLIRRILTIGVPSAMENGLFQFGKIIVVGMISGFGTAQIAANSMSNSISSLTILAGQAVSLAVVTVVGQCVGAQELGQARRYTFQLVGLAELLVTAPSGLVLLLLPLFIRLYGASPDTAAYIRTVMYINCASMPLFWVVSFVLPNALRAANDVRFTSAVSIFSMWVFRVGFSYVLGVRLGWGVVGVWAAMVLDWVIRCAFFAPRFLSGAWKKHAIFQPARR